MQEKCKKNAIHVHNKYKYAKICKPQICSYVKKTIFHSWSDLGTKKTFKWATMNTSWESWDYVLMPLLEVFVVSICHHFWPFGNTEGARFKRQQASRCCGSCPRTCQFKNWWENICTLWCSRSSYMQKKLIKTSTWYVKFRLPVHNAPDFHIAQCIKQVLNSSDHKRHIGTLSNVSFSYSAQHRWYRNIINMWTNLEMYCRVQ